MACSGGRPPPLEKTLSQPIVSTTFSLKELKNISNSEIILIGETHDHPQHHLIQARLIKQLQPQVVAFEMLNASQQESLNQLSAHPKNEWDKLLSWTKRGWPDFSLYQPVFEAAIEVNAKLIAAHPDPILLAPLKIGASLSRELITRLKLDQPLSIEQKKALSEEITKAHCGHASPPLVKAMIQAQRLKDAWMAEKLLQEKGKRVLIVGRGHLHPQRGIPWAIKQFKPTPLPQIATIHLSPSPKVLHADTKKVKHFSLQIKAHRHDDPCERFKEQLKRLKKRQQHSH